MGGGSIAYDQMMAMRQQQQNASFMQNLGRFAMMAGSGIAQGIGTGLAQTDLRNPFVGAGASITGGMQVGNVATSQLMQRMGEQAAFPERLEREREASRARREEILGQAEEDRGTFKGIASGVQGTAMQPTTSIEQQMEAEENPMGLRAGLSQMSPYGKMFVAQQGLMSARENMASDRARRIMLGMGM
jgi:hypothetical protein